jgi:hypothetical protein
MSRRRPTKPERLSPALARLIEAAELHGEDAEGRDIKGAARALREFGNAALWVLPIYGVFVPNDNGVAMIVESVAREHLGLEEARAEFRKALEGVEPFDRRDPIESAHNQVRTVAEEAYFYAGLAFSASPGPAGRHFGVSGGYMRHNQPRACDWDENQGGNVTGCSGCVTNETHCFANVSVGSRPAGIIPCGVLGRRSIVAVSTDQFAPPHVSVGLRHQEGRAGGDD